MMEFLKNKKKMTITATVLAAIVAIGVISISANAAMTVNSYTADTGALSSVLELNGTVETNTCKTYYSKVDGIIGTVHVKEGDFVKKGDIIVSYDAAEIERLTAIAELGAQADLGNYNNSIQTGNRTAGLYGEAKRNLGVLDQQIADTQAAITQTEKDLLERKASLADEGAKLQISLIEWSDEPDSEEYENLQKLIQSNAYQQQYSNDIVQMQEELNRLNVQLAACKEYKAEMTSQKASTQLGLMTSGAKEELEAIKAANELASNDRIENYKAASEGIKAEFDGVVTEIGVVEGSDVARGTKLVTLKSVDDVVVRLNVNKYDIINIEEGQSATVAIKNKDYTGKISRIERMTKESGQNTGIGVEVKLDEPDSDIILGIEAKAKVSTADLAEVLRVPTLALWEDEEGTFVCVARDSKAIKTAVETGVRNDDMVEIVSGINPGDVVVWNDTAEITDGMSIKID